MNFRAVLFDLDGTLLDSLEDIAQAANDVLSGLDFPTHPPVAYRGFIGDGVAMLFRRALPPDRVEPDMLDRCAAGFEETYARCWNVRTRPYDGVPGLLDALTARGLDLGVLSNKPDDFTRLCVAEYLARWQFRAVLGQREGVPRKPDPASALEIARGLHIPAEQFLYVGDTAVDMETAQQAGMYPVGVAWGFRPVEELRSGGARAIIDRPIELLEFLQGQRP